MNLVLSYFHTLTVLFCYFLIARILLVTAGNGTNLYDSSSFCACQCCSSLSDADSCSSLHWASVVLSSPSNCSLECSNELCSQNFPSLCSGARPNIQASCAINRNVTGQWKNAGRCDTSTCCCPIGLSQFDRSSAGVTQLSLTLSGNSLLSCPDSLKISFGFLFDYFNPFYQDTFHTGGLGLLYKLSQDGKLFNLTSLDVPKCSETFIKEDKFESGGNNKGNPNNSSARINSSFIPMAYAILAFLMTMLY
jgi:hypothetical protein